jgi:predicted nucleic acid-binding protein
MDAFDADVLIYAAAPKHPLGMRVAALLSDPDPIRVDSTLLLPELLTKPIRIGDTVELAALTALLSRIVLRPVDQPTAELAVALGARHRLRPADAVHLATAVAAGADRFITTNKRDFDRSITEVAITFPDELL